MSVMENDVATTGELEGAPKHRPYISDQTIMPEFTLGALVVGSVLGIIFAASSLYLVLKVGMTVSASIPVAVLAITVFRAFSRLFGIRRASILENNIVQTAGSAGESIAFGVGVTMPALLLLGFEMSLPRVMVVSLLGGTLGILAMIPLRRAFIVKLHGRPGEPGTLLYPEGTACAQVLISGEKGGAAGATVFAGFGLAFAHKFVTEGMNLLMSTVRVPIQFINRAAVFAGEMASELLGVGYIIGLRTSAIMMAGAVLGYLVIIPTIYFIGENSNAIVPPGDKPIRQMGISELRNNYLLFVGAGCVASAGIISMFRTLPMIVRSVGSGLASLGNRSGTGVLATDRRTEKDMSMRVVLLGSLGLIGVLALFLMVEVSATLAVLGAVLVVLFGFLFVTVSARLTGEIGSSSNPISGMTVATLMLTCLIFLGLGLTSSKDRLLALSIAAVVCVASSNGGTTAQSLKTGFLVGGTPKAMQYAILIGAFASAFVIGITLLGFNASGTVFSRKSVNVPDFNLTQDELNRLPETDHEGRKYKVWATQNDLLTSEDSKTGFKPTPQRIEQLSKIRAGFYLVDSASGKLAVYKDFSIMGRLRERDDGSPVSREFDAPKTQVMGIIINGVLKRDLNWSMVAIGGMIAIMLELCGVSALAFAVGVYVPIQFSVPIFIGGIVRWVVDTYLARSSAAEVAAAGNDPEARARAEIEAIRRSETSPGVLLASGYIAGGSLAGVLIAFLAFSNEIPKDLAQWQYGTVSVSKALALPDAAREAATQRLGLSAAPADPAEQARVEQLAGEIEDLNRETLALWVPVPKDMEVKLPAGKSVKPATNTTLGQLAKESLGRSYKAKEILDLNEELALPAVLPAGAALRVPQTYWPALVAFATLTLVLVLVGIRRISESPVS